MQPYDPILDLLDFDDAQIFAVVDGAMVEDLPKVLADYNLSARPLYYDHQNHFANVSGPHLIHCPDESVIVTVRRAFPANGVVWWVWADADESHAKAAIFRHLRGLGMAEIPEGYPNPPRPRAPMERVLFRHADARVMARVLPVLEPDQRARLFGKAGALVLDVGGSLRRALVPAGLPLAPPGFLRLTAEQMDAIGQSQLADSHKRIAAYLRKHIPEGFDQPDDLTLAAIVNQSDKVGRDLGVRSEKAHARWAYLMMLSNGDVGQMPDVRKKLLDAPSADLAVKELMDGTLIALRNSLGLGL